MKPIYFSLLIGIFSISSLSVYAQSAPGTPTKPNEYIKEIQGTLDLPTTRETGKKELTGMFAFVVETDGSLSEVKVLDSLGFGVDEQVITQLQNSKNWAPVVLNGQPMRVAYKLPLRIKLPRKQTAKQE